MKVIRSNEWKPAGWFKHFPTIGAPAYVFKNKEYGDVIACPLAKFVDVKNNIVYIYNAYKHEIVRLHNDDEFEQPSLPSYRAFRIG